MSHSCCWFTLCSFSFLFVCCVLFRIRSFFYFVANFSRTRLRWNKAKLGSVFLKFRLKVFFVLCDLFASEGLPMEKKLKSGPRPRPPKKSRKQDVVFDDDTSDSSDDDEQVSRWFFPFGRFRICFIFVLMFTADLFSFPVGVVQGAVFQEEQAESRIRRRRWRRRRWRRRRIGSWRRWWKRWSEVGWAKFEWTPFGID